MSNDMVKIDTDNNFQFSATNIDKLGATEYTLVNVVVDTSSSVSFFKDELENSIKSIVEACNKSSRAENLLIRLSTFNSNLFEEHGFKALFDIDNPTPCPNSPSRTGANHRLQAVG